MSVTIIRVVNEGEESFVSIHSPVVFLKGIIKLILQVDCKSYSIYKNLKTEKWFTDNKTQLWKGNEYFRGISSAIDKTVSFCDK